MDWQFYTTYINIITINSTYAKESEEYTAIPMSFIVAVPLIYSFGYYYHIYPSLIMHNV